MTRRRYQIKVSGSLDPTAREALAGLAPEDGAAVTVLSGDLDQRGLHAVLDQMRALGLELVEITQGGR